MLTKLRSQSLRPVIAALGLAAVAIGASMAVSQPAEARGVFVFGFGAPVYYPPPYYAYPPPYYYPPPVVYAPPAVYAPPVVAPPIVGSPASDPYTASNGQTCREYQTTMTIDGQPQQTHGTACLQPDGTWRIVN